MSSQVSGSLITRKYGNFRGVDFTNRYDEVNVYRSPDALNVWKNYKSTQGRSIETRPTESLYDTFDNTIYGIFFYEINSQVHSIVHSGTKLYDVFNGGKTLIYSGLKPSKSQSFVYANIFYLKDGLNYLEYNGETCAEVVGFIPTTSISRIPAGGGTLYQDLNLLSDYRINTFVGDGTSTDYYVDVKSFDNETPIVKILNDNGVWVQTTDFTSYPLEGRISFNTAPAEPNTDGQDNVSIQFKKVVPGNRNLINKCDLLEVFDNRVFFSGNIDTPNTIYHSSLDNPRYVSMDDFYTEGLDIAPVKTMVAGNNALWVIKAPSQSNTTIYYHNPVIDSEYGKTYPSIHSSISIGCTSTGRNFNDDIIFFSPRGMEGISGDVTTEQVIAHRSSLIDGKLLNENNYNKLQLEEWQGYLLVIVDNKIYLADSREKAQINDHIEYEWYYWEFKENITYAKVYNDELYLCCDNKVYRLDGTEDIESYWCTLQDEFNYPHYQKTTNKRGFVADMEGEAIVYSRINNEKFEKIDKFKNKKGYVVPRLKAKKWKSIQIKFLSKKRFNLYSFTLEAYVGAYLKR